MNKLHPKIQKYVEFANFCSNNQLDPHQTGVLITLVQKRARIATKLSNGDGDTNKLNRQDDMLLKQIATQAKELGLTPNTDSIIVSFQRKPFSQTIFLPKV